MALRCCRALGGSLWVMLPEMGQCKIWFECFGIHERREIEIKESAENISESVLKERIFFHGNN